MSKNTFNYTVTQSIRVVNQISSCSAVNGINNFIFHEYLRIQVSASHHTTMIKHTLSFLIQALYSGF